MPQPARRSRGCRSTSAPASDWASMSPRFGSARPWACSSRTSRRRPDAGLHVHEPAASRSTSSTRSSRSSESSVPSVGTPPGERVARCPPRDRRAARGDGGASSARLPRVQVAAPAPRGAALVAGPSSPTSRPLPPARVRRSGLPLRPCVTRQRPTGARPTSTLDPETVARALATGDVQLVDVREPHEWEAGPSPAPAMSSSRSSRPRRTRSIAAADRFLLPRRRPLDDGRRRLPPRGLIRRATRSTAGSSSGIEAAGYPPGPDGGTVADHWRRSAPAAGRVMEKRRAVARPSSPPHRPLSESFRLSSVSRERTPVFLDALQTRERVPPPGGERAIGHASRRRFRTRSFRRRIRAACDQRTGASGSRIDRVSAESGRLHRLLVLLVVDGLGV